MIARISFTNSQLNYYILLRGGNEEDTTHITSEGTSKPSHISSSHEEADTKMILHAMDANIMFERSHEKGQMINSISRYRCASLGTLLLPANVYYLKALDTDSNARQNMLHTCA